MKLFLYAILGLIFAYLVYLTAFSAINGELTFSNDIARDFLLLKELDEKKLVLIGPRSSTQGLFYSSFLTYINYPAYLIGGGNPVVVAWFWVLICIAFFITSFYLVRNLFGVFTASIYTLLVAAKIVPKSNEIFEPMAMYFVMPIFLFTIFQYVKTKRPRYLFGHLVALSVFLHLSLGIGIQFLILSGAVVLYSIIKSKKWKHLMFFLFIPASLINLILFDLKYGFGMAKALLGTGGATKFFVSIPDWIDNRIHHTVSMQLLDNNNSLWIPIFVIILIFTFIEIRTEPKKKHIYILLSFYYLGYIALSYFNKGILLVHYVFLLIPLTTLWLASFLSGKHKPIFIPIVIMIFTLNVVYAIEFTHNLKNSFINRHPNSWVGLSNVAKDVAEKYKGESFGYYVFAPDAFAYQPRYAMMYVFDKENADSHEYKKMDKTLVIAQAPPVDDEFMDYKWWVKTPLRINSVPAEIKDYPNGYKLIEYRLSKEEQKIEHDKSIELGIHFR